MDIFEDISNKLINLNYLLDRKIEILNEILIISKSQFNVYNNNDNEDKDLFIKNSITEKQKLIDELLQIDDMFFRIFKEFSGKLNENKEKFKYELSALKQKIHQVTKIDLEIKFQEEKNKTKIINFEKLANNPTINNNLLKSGRSSLVQKYKNNNQIQ